MHPQQIFKNTQASKLGDPPVHPLLRQQLSVRPSFHYIFITSCVMCYAWSVSLFTFLEFFLLCLLQSQVRPQLYFVWERNTLSLNQNSSQDLHAYFLSCELFFFFSQVLPCLVVVLQFSSRAFVLSQVELSIGCMFYLVQRVSCCTEFCVLTRKQVVEVAILFVVVTCNSFEVLTRVMFELLVSRARDYQ